MEEEREEEREERGEWREGGRKNAGKAERQEGMHERSRRCIEWSSADMSNWRRSLCMYILFQVSQ